MFIAQFPGKPDDGLIAAELSEGPMVIFDCNGVLVDSEPIASAVLAQAFTRAGFPVNAEVVTRRFHGRRPADIFHTVEAAMGAKLPAGFASSVSVETLRRFRTELRALPHVAHALTWIRGPKAVASSSPLDRIRISLETAGLLRFFGSRLFSASDVARGKPAPDLFRLAAAQMHVEPGDCIVLEDSAAGVAAAVATGMTVIGFVGGSLTPGRLATDLVNAGARTVLADMRALKSTITDLRGW
jgi:HAD superfamily hydrolase (TIGR01509 family)